MQSHAVPFGHPLFIRASGVAAHAAGRRDYRKDVQASASPALVYRAAARRTTTAIATSASSTILLLRTEPNGRLDVPNLPRVQKRRMVEDPDASARENQSGSGKSDGSTYAVATPPNDLPDGRRVRSMLRHKMPREAQPSYDGRHAHGHASVHGDRPLVADVALWDGE